MGWDSPAAYFFEGLVSQSQGKTSEAEECWAKAAVNPVFTDGGGELKGITNIKGDALRRLRDEAIRVEDEIFKLYVPVYLSIPRHEKNYDPVYLAEQAAACLNKDEIDAAGALAYYKAALSVNPFSGYNYAGVAVAYISIGDGDAVETYLKEGLIIDPESNTLKELISKIKGVNNE
jgi:tetratricopeptide (TPR) repeat protein